MKSNLGKEELEKLKEIDEELRKNLKESRYRHTVSVAHTAACLAMVYNAPLYDTMLAGLLHDCAKHLSDEELLKHCRKKNISINSVEEKNPALLHARYGAYLAENKYKVKDKDVLSAIEFHTTGRPGMTLLEKIIYIADFMEPYRNQAPNLSEIRKLAFKDLNEALKLTLKSVIEYLDSNKMPVDEITQKTYDYYR
ncbi:MAG: bis(5'-nucleosyl)-tetraphosphatase (symmetrical) YqeK [Lachnospiraceae bacterium]|nr:bis(5'-nucleosyl)-tetraphosphatase (symmetrical) YqeK [Lachnospiraceae bacterium]